MKKKYEAKLILKQINNRGQVIIVEQVLGVRMRVGPCVNGYSLILTMLC